MELISFWADVRRMLGLASCASVRRREISQHIPIGGRLAASQTRMARAIISMSSFVAPDVHPSFIVFTIIKMFFVYHGKALLFK